MVEHQNLYQFQLLVSRSSYKHRHERAKRQWNSRKEVPCGWVNLSSSFEDLGVGSFVFEELFGERDGQGHARSGSTKPTVKKYPQQILLPAHAASCPMSCLVSAWLSPPPSPSRLGPRNPIHRTACSVCAGSVLLAPAQNQNQNQSPGRSPW